MNDTVSVGKASLDALTESLRAQSIALDAARERISELEAKVAELRAILAHSKTSLAENFNDPMQGDGEAAQ